MRESGIWADYQGRHWRVAGPLNREKVWLDDDASSPSPMIEVPISKIGLVEDVMTRATWRNGDVVVGREVEPGVVRIYSYDAALAARESLHGDQHAGWTGIASIDELQDVKETVKVLRTDNLGNREEQP